MKPKIAVKWDMIDLVFIRKNFPVMTWNELLTAINEIRSTSEQVEISALRHQVRRMGLSKGIQIRWSQKDISFLRSNYTKIGNVEMADILNKKNSSFRIIDGKKNYRTFTKKHIEKKLKLLRLYRTPEEILSIKRRNLTTTNYRVLTSECNQWTQGTRKAAREEETRVWRGVRYVKVNGKFTPYTRWFYHNFIQPIPKGFVVYHLDSDVLNDRPDNLACVPRRSQKIIMSGYKAALPLLAKQEKDIIEILPCMNYDKQRSEIRQMHIDLNRIRGLQRKINELLMNRNMADLSTKQLTRRNNILHRLRIKGIRVNTKDRIIIYPFGKNPLAILQIRQLTKEFNFNVQFEII